MVSENIIHIVSCLHRLIRLWSVGIQPPRWKCEKDPKIEADVQKDPKDHSEGARQAQSYIVTAMVGLAEMVGTRSRLFRPASRELMSVQDYCTPILVFPRKIGLARSRDTSSLVYYKLNIFNKSDTGVQQQL